MARLDNGDYTRLSDRTIAGTGLGTSPEAIAGLADLQRAVYDDQPQDTKQALDTATAADGKAVVAKDTADAAQGAADAAALSAADAGTRADAAQTRADAAYALADTKVLKDAGPQFQAMTGTATRTAMAVYNSPTAADAYDKVQIQILMDSVQAAERRLKAVIDDLLANGALKD